MTVREVFLFSKTVINDNHFVLMWCLVIHAFNIHLAFYNSEVLKLPGRKLMSLNGSWIALYKMTPSAAARLILLGM